MRKLILIFFLLPFLVSGQEYSDYLPDVAWRTLIDSVIYQNTDTFTVKVNPVDLNDPGAFDKIIGDFLMDNKGRRYEIIDSSTVSNYRVVTVVDVFESGAAPYQGLIGWVYNSAGGSGISLSAIQYEQLDNKAFDYGNRIDNSILWLNRRDSVWVTATTDTLFIGGDTIINNVDHDTIRLSTYIDFDTIYTATGDEDKGMFFWDEDNLTYSGGLGYGVVGQLFLEQYVLVKNETGSQIDDGQPVMYAGTVGGSGKLRGQLAIADNSIPANYIIGIATQDIPNNDWGYVTSFGNVRGLNCSGTPYGETWNDGDLIYVSADVAGELTNVAPEAPNTQIFVGIVGNNSSTVGELIVRPVWNRRIEDAADVDGTELTTNGQILVWNNDSSYFDPDYNITDYLKTDDFNSYNDSINSIYITNADEADPLFQDWDKTTGINIFEKQVIDLQDYLLDSDLSGIRDTLTLHSDSLTLAFDSIGVHRTGIDELNDSIDTHRTDIDQNASDISTLQSLDVVEFSDTVTMIGTKYDVDTLTINITDNADEIDDVRDSIPDYEEDPIYAGDSANVVWFSDTTDLIGTKYDLEGYLKLDQSTPQTITDSIPFLEASRLITEHHHLVDKLYVDNAVSALGQRFYMLSTASGVAGYYNTQITPSDEAESSVTATDPDDDELIAGWISPTDGAPSKLIAGVYEWHTYAAKSGGNKTYKLWWTLVEREDGGAETVIGTSAESNLVTETKTHMRVSLALSEDYELEVDSRIVGKIYVAVVSGASATDLTLYAEGNSDSHWEIPVNKEILDEVYVQYSDTTSLIGTKYDIDTLSTNVYSEISDVNDSIDDHRTLIDANTGKDTTGIYHTNRDLLDAIDAADTTRWNSFDEWNKDYADLINTPNFQDSISTYQTDDQTLSIDSTGRVFTISIEDGNSVTFEDTNTQIDTTNLRADIDQNATDISNVRDSIPDYEEDLIYAGDSANIVWFVDLTDSLNVVRDTTDDLRVDIDQNANDIIELNDSINQHRTELGEHNDSIVSYDSRLTAIEGTSYENYTHVTETFYEDDSTPTEHSLSDTGIEAVVVSLNGNVLKSDDYTFTSSSITLDCDVYQYDEVTIIYLK